MIFKNLILKTVLMCMYSNSFLSEEVPIIRYFHGINDLCPSNHFDQHFPSYDIKCVKLNKGDFGTLKSQIRDGCEMLQKEEEVLKEGFVLVGISQGGLLARGILQICEMGKYVKRFISIGGPQNGIAISPGIKNNKDINEFLYFLCRFGLRYFVVPCNYFKPLNHQKVYLNSEVDLVDINNEKNINQNYIERILQLEVFVNISFLKDEVVIPYNSGNFGYFKDKEYDSFVEFEDTPHYSDNILGLRTLHEDTRFFRCEVEGGHLHLTHQVYEKIIYLFSNQFDYSYLDKLDHLKEFCRFKENN